MHRSDAGEGRLPNFLVIGAMKAGTSSLYRYLRDHPQVFMPAKKELHFFGRATWDRELEDYRRSFVGAGEALAVGEASPSYSKHPKYPGVPARIATVLPDVRLIYLIRDPIERMRSHYLHAVLVGRERDPIDRALLEKPKYVDASRYAMQIERYLEHFSLDQLLVIAAEELRRDRRETIGRVFRFLGVDSSWAPPNISVEFHRTLERWELRPAL